MAALSDGLLTELDDEGYQTQERYHHMYTQLIGSRFLVPRSMETGEVKASNGCWQSGKSTVES